MTPSAIRSKILIKKFLIQLNDKLDDPNAKAWDPTQNTTFLSARVMRNTVWCALRRAYARTSSLNYLTKAIKDDFQLRLFHEWEPLSLKRLILQFTQYSPSKGKAYIVAAAIRKTVNETIGEFEKSKSIVK